MGDKYSFNILVTDADEPHIALALTDNAINGFEEDNTIWRAAFRLPCSAFQEICGDAQCMTLNMLAVVFAMIMSENHCDHAGPECSVQYAMSAHAHVHGQHAGSL